MAEIIFIRNAQGDSETLGSEGEAQSRQAGERLKELGFVPDVVFTSDNPRCRRTGELMAEELGIQPQFVVLPKLENLMDEEIYHMHVAWIFEELGLEQPIAEYLERDAKGILLSRAKVVAKEILAEARKNPGTQKILIVGHHIVQNLVGIALAGEDPILLGPEFGHLMGFWIHKDKSVTEVNLAE